MEVVELCLFVTLIIAGCRAYPIHMHKSKEFEQNKSTKESFKCTACVLLVNYALSKTSNDHDKKSTDELLEWIEKGCEYFGLETTRVCQGGVRAFGDEVIQVLPKVNLTAEEICGISMPDTCHRRIDRTESNMTKWEIRLPPKPTRRGAKQNGTRKENKQTLKVLHLSDLHIDPQYSIGSRADCDEPLCCRDNTRPALSKALDPEMRGSEVEKPESSAGRWGDYRKCDLPWWTLENLLQNVPEGIDYVIWTGDQQAHDIWSQSIQGSLDMLFNVTYVLVENLPLVPVYPAVGNHDTFPSNNFPPAKVHTKGKYAVKWFYEALAKAWSPWLLPDALETVKRGGFYTTLVRPGFRIVSLNTNFCYIENWWLWLEPVDPTGMLTWFVQVLFEAERLKEKVHVIGHVPPSKKSECMRVWSLNYYRIVERFQDIITGQFFGHTHRDEVQVFYSEEQRPLSVAYSAPSVTPYSWMDPSYRIFQLDGFHRGSTWSVLNYQTYVLDLNEVHQSRNVSWKLEYDACTAYNAATMTKSVWDEMLRDWVRYLQSENYAIPESLERYLRFYIRNEQIPLNKISDYLSCTELEECIRDVVCDIAWNMNLSVCNRE